ncbi:MAG TPA: transposase [Vicinamibacterales bacterium]
MIPPNSVQHVLNRGNRRAAIFHEDSDYERFTNILADAAERVPMRLLALCLMPNHWHLVVWVRSGDELPAYMQWLSSTHVQQHQRKYGTRGTGHLYQARYRNFPVQQEAYLYSVLRYVEANARTANLVRRAEHWAWSSAIRKGSADGRALLSDWPLKRPHNWLDYVNKGIPKDELLRLRQSARRGTPYGSDSWVNSVAQDCGLESTLVPVGRPAQIDVVENSWTPID